MQTGKSTIGQRITAIQIAENMNLREFSQALRISPPHLSLLKNDRREPSNTLLELIIYRFKIQRDWLYEGKGNPVVVIQEEKPGVTKNRREELERDALVAACVIGPILPIVSGTIAVGVGAAHILSKVCNAYKVKNAANLAKRLGVDRSTIKYWVENNNVPTKYLQKSFAETSLEPQDVIGADDLILINKSRLKSMLKKLIEEKSELSLQDGDLDGIIEQSRPLDLATAIT